MIDDDRGLGTFVGLAIGDALGAPVEFYRRGRFTPLSEMREGGKFKMRLGEWTDDTAMALCLAESLIEVGGFDAVDQIERYWRWGNEGHHSTRSYPFGMGKTVASALGRYKRTGDPYSGSADPLTAGNGSIMRLSPVVLYYGHNYKQTIHFAQESSRTTHQAPEALQSCAVLAHILYKAIRGAAEKSELFVGLTIPEASNRLQSVIQRRYIEKDESAISGSGYVVESLEAALWAFETTNSFESAVLKAANLGDDSDTTAAVCGQIAGAFYGHHAIPNKWLDVLFQRDKIESMTRRLISSRENARNFPLTQ